MFNNMKKIIALALPVVTLTLTSCGNRSKTITYDKMRRFASEQYDQYALDSIPTTYKYDFNKMQAVMDVDYTTPSGGSQTFAFSFGFNGIHAVLKDRYAVCLSSSLVDKIEKYYSDFVGLAISLKEEPPIQMLYHLIGDNCTMIDLSANEKLVGSVLVELLQFGAGVIDLVSSFTGFIPSLDQIDSAPKTTQMIMMYIYQLVQLLVSSGKQPAAPDHDPEKEGEGEGEEKAINVTNTIFSVLNYSSITVSDSSKASGETFYSYLTTDSHGFLDAFNFIFKSSFTITGQAAFKRYATNSPKAGDRPISTDEPYHYTLTGSCDFDFNVVSQYN